MRANKFFVVSGKGVSATSRLNAFDRALHDAGIAQCNLVHVSSIIPEDCEKVDFYEIPPGEITFCVLARMDGEAGERIAAGISWCYVEGEGFRYGLVAEDEGYKTPEAVEGDLDGLQSEMVDARNMKITQSNKEVVSLDEIPEGHFGSVIAALVYVFD